MKFYNQKIYIIKTNMSLIAGMEDIMTHIKNQELRIQKLEEEKQKLQDENKKMKDMLLKFKKECDKVKDK